jgi:molybdopterin molybdotransferase
MLEPHMGSQTPPRLRRASDAAELVPVADVLARVLALARPLPAETMSLTEAVGLVVAEDVVSPTALPRFDNAAMDGFAVHASDLHGAAPEAPVDLPVVGTSVAGAPCRVSLTPGSAFRVATGAPVPEGADAVVRLEDAEGRADPTDRVMFRAPVAAETNVRRAGEDVIAGETLLRAGTPMGPGQIAAAAAVGLARLVVHPPPRVGLVVTGDEVITPRLPMGEAKVNDAVGPALMALLTAARCRPFLRGPVPDDPSDIGVAISDLVQSSDAVVTVGGVSVGPRDHVGSVLMGLGADVVSVAIRPGKPFAFGRSGHTLLFGLPGNPVSALAAFEVFVRPALSVLLGHPAGARTRVVARLSEPFRQRPGRMHLVRALLSESGDGSVVRPLGPHSAGSLGSLAGANAWMVVPPEIERLDEGAKVETWPMLPS